jgi:hypothetical protein
MGPVVLGVIALLVILWALTGFAKANPKALAKVVRLSGGIIAVVGAVFLAVRGQIGLAIPIGAAGLGMLGWGPLRDVAFGGVSAPAGRVSRVKAPFVEMELDHDSGKMGGQIVSGRYQGVTLDSIDAESSALIAAYLDRRNPRWREHDDSGAAAGQGHSPSTGKMTEQEAEQILGIAQGASADDIRRAHRLLMKKLHPDQGGSTYLAARVNEAKEVLLRRHR